MPSSSGSSTPKEPFPEVPDIYVPPASTASVPRATSAPSGIPSVGSGNRPASSSRVHYDLNVDTQMPDPASTHLSPLSAGAEGASGTMRSDTGFSGIRRRNTRSNTFKTIQEYEGRPGWHPGAEPGIDTSKPDGGHASTTAELRADCQITIVDFSQDHMEVHEFDNAELIEFLKDPQPNWVKCRWISVNGLSWDVIQALGNYKKLHSLAVEDLTNPSNRTKADWYSSHAFLILPCLKLVRILDPDSSDDDDDDDDTHSVKSRSSMVKKEVKRWWRMKRADRADKDASGNGDRLEKAAITHNNDLAHQATSFSDVFNPKTFRTLQGYHASPNDARNDYMERHSVLAARSLGVMAEQVAMFLTSDNTVIAFFEQSADDVEKPILARLRSSDTILRQSCDASMVGQAILDAIIDMAIPVAACYADIVGDLELDVLTRPNIRHTKSLYIIISEISKMLSLVNPISSLIAALRDHKTALAQEAAAKELQNPSGGVIITPMTHTYLADVYDHCLMITEALNQTKTLADNMIDLIFNTISANQNESMKQLTIVTIIFLPLTFLTGYFGQNFDNFTELERGTVYFWYIAIPVSIAVILLLMRDMLLNWFITAVQRRRVLTVRKRRKERIDRQKEFRKKLASGKTF